MTTRVFNTKKLDVRCDKAWDAIRGIGRLDVWFPILETCVVEGNGVGAIRRMTKVGGGEIVDHIKEIDLQNRRLVYLRTISPLPITYYKGTVEVFESFDSLAIVSWTIDFDSAPENSKQVAQGLNEAIGTALHGMNKDLLSEK